MSEQPVLDLETGGNMVQRATDPLINPAYVQPVDFTEQYPTPLDTTEILRLCEEVSLLQAIPTIRTNLSVFSWREMTALAFTGSSTSQLSFADGYCPEEYYHDGENQTVTIKNIGAKKNLSIRDIMHSRAVAGMGQGINQLVGGFPAGEGLPGGDGASFQREFVRDVKEKEVRLAMTLVMNGWDRLLVDGSTAVSSLEFDGIQEWATNTSCTMHTNTNTSSGTFSAASFDQFLYESCAKPTHVFGHPSAIQEMMSAYFQLGFQGSQVVNFTGPGDRIVPGYNFASFVNTGIGRLQVVADNNFRKTAAGATTFQADLWAFRMTHNGEPLVYQVTQIPLSLNDLVPGCTAISFEVWAATALVIKACCAQGKYTSQFTGRLATTCTTLG